MTLCFLGGRKNRLSCEKGLPGIERHRRMPLVSVCDLPGLICWAHAPQPFLCGVIRGRAHSDTGQAPRLADNPSVTILGGGSRLECRGGIPRIFGHRMSHPQPNYRPPHNLWIFLSRHRCPSSLRIQHRSSEGPYKYPLRDRWHLILRAGTLGFLAGRCSHGRKHPEKLSRRERASV